MIWHGVRNIGRRVLKLFVDSVGLASGALGCAAVAAVAIREGAAPGAAACLMLAGLAAVLAVSIGAAMRARRRVADT